MIFDEKYLSEQEKAREKERMDEKKWRAESGE